jgi:hypothetical protein
MGQRRDIQHNDTQNNDTQHSGISCDIYHNVILSVTSFIAALLFFIMCHRD